MNAEKCIPLVVVVGPTASGKTSLSIELAKCFQGEIVSADSMQIYRHMNIGTAKPSPEEMQGIPHHMLDFLEPSQSFSVADYVERTHDCIREIHSRGKLPVLAGGTGLYVSSLINNLQFSESASDPALRRALQQKAKESGGEVLLEELKTFDPETADSLHPNNIGRIIRAIEVYRTTGITMTESLKRSKEVPSPYNLCMLGLNYRSRERLYARINQRVDQMMEQGLLEEAERVLGDQSFSTARQAIGYKEFLPYFSGEIALKDAVEDIKRETRRYAKRQLTWFRRDPRIFWVYPDELQSWEQTVEIAKKQVAKWKQLW